MERCFLCWRRAGTALPSRGGWFAVACCPLHSIQAEAFLAGRREDWADPVPLLLCGLCKPVFASWQPKVSRLQGQRVCRRKIMVLTGGLWGKHLHNLFIRRLLLQLSSDFRSPPVCWLPSWEPLLSRPWTAIQLVGDVLPDRSFPLPLLPSTFLSAEQVLLLSNIRCPQLSC